MAGWAYRGGPEGRVGGRGWGRGAREWVGRVGRAYMVKRAGLYMDKMGNMGRDDRSVNRDRTVADKNTGKW